jgi:hypothetical protein
LLLLSTLSLLVAVLPFVDLVLAGFASLFELFADRPMFVLAFVVLSTFPLLLDERVLVLFPTFPLVEVDRVLVVLSAVPVLLVDLVLVVLVADASGL